MQGRRLLTALTLMVGVGVSLSCGGLGPRCALEDFDRRCVDEHTQLLCQRPLWSYDAFETAVPCYADTFCVEYPEYSTCLAESKLGPVCPKRGAFRCEGDAVQTCARVGLESHWVSTHTCANEHPACLQVDDLAGCTNPDWARCDAPGSLQCEGNQVTECRRFLTTDWGHAVPRVDCGTNTCTEFERGTACAVAPLEACPHLDELRCVEERQQICGLQMFGREDNKLFWRETTTPCL
jgi:hypothetical protein